MIAQTNWHGTKGEAEDLIKILSKNCKCGVDALGVRNVTCEGHDMLTHDQQALDGLLWYRHLAERLLTEEFRP